MAQLVLGAVGAVIGGIYGGPAGAQLGWAIGSSIGSLIDPPKGPTVEGPKLSDLKTQTADYGTVLPVVYGTVRMAGNVLWADEIKETKNKKKEGGKGGPTQTTITYIYSVSCAVGLCEGIITGVRRIWANSELIYSATEGATAGTISESGKLAGQFRVYTGTEDQMPDPTIQAKKGANNTVPYRGVAYIVFTDLELTKFGNRMPNLEFEIVKSGEVHAFHILNNIEQIAPFNKEDGVNMIPRTIRYSEGEGQGFDSYVTPQFTSSADGVFRWTSPVLLEFGPNDPNIRPKIWKEPKLTISLDGNAQSGLDITGTTMTQEWAERNGPVQYNSKNIDGLMHDMQAVCKLNDGFVEIYTPSDQLANDTISIQIPQDVEKFRWGGKYLIDASFNGGEPTKDDYMFAYWNLMQSFPVGEHGRYVVGLSGSSDKNSMIVFTSAEPLKFTPNLETQTTADRFHIFKIVNGVPRIVQSGTLDQPRMVTFELGLFGQSVDYKQTFFPYNYGTSGFVSILESNATSFWAAGAGGLPLPVGYLHDLFYYEIESDVLTFKEKFNLNNFVSVPPYYGRSSGSIFANNGLFMYFCYGREYFNENPLNNLSYTVVGTRNPYITKNAVPVSEIVADQLGRVGFKPNDYNVSELTDLCDGFFLANRPSIRTAIETLTGPFFFDVVESDEYLKFVKRGKPPVRTITALEMGASDGGNPADRPETLTVTRQQELSQIKEIATQYQDRDADYRVGVQYARRQITSAVNEQTIQLPMVMTATKAKNVVDAVLFNAWAEREKFEWSTDRRHIDLEPTDLVILQSMNGNTWTARITSRAEGADGTIKWEAVGDLGEIYNPMATGIPVPPTTGEQVQTSVPTFQLAFNAPPLQNTIDAPGFYVAATGYTDGWAGSIAYRSIDGGNSYQLLDSSAVDRSEDSTLGFIPTALGNWEGGNILDTVNEITVNVIGTGELANATYGSVLNGANAMWIGGEIIQFQNVTQLTGNTYKLSRLRRGRYGTERFIGTHSTNENFALLTVNDTQFVSESLGNIGVNQLIRGVSLDNTTPTNVQPSQFTFDATTIKPLAPAQAIGVTQPDKAVNFKWFRCARLNAEWFDQIDVPLDEPQELYVVEISDVADFSNIVRTVDGLTTPAYNYSVADRTADTGSTTTPLFGRVFQISSRVGRGFPANFEIL